MAQLGARFHGMEEVIGSIPIRSTNHFNNLDWPNCRRRTACVMVCVITPHFAAIGEAFHRCALGFHADVTVPLQHLAADVPCNRHDGRVCRPAFCQRRDRAVPKIVEPEALKPRFLRQSPPSGPPAIDVARRVKLGHVVAYYLLSAECELGNEPRQRQSEVGSCTFPNDSSPRQ